LINGCFDYNIHPCYRVIQSNMKRSFRVWGKLEQQTVFWFVNRSTELGCYALDEAFSPEEAQRLERFLLNRRIECRIQVIVPACAGAEDSPAWNLIGRLVELENGDQLPFPVVGCLEA
jgi:hypothetical protein